MNERLKNTIGEHLMEKVGTEVPKIAGLEDALVEATSGTRYLSHSISDLKISEDGQAAAYIIDTSNWGSSPGACFSAYVCAYVNGKDLLVRGDEYRNAVHERYDKPQYSWSWIDDFRIEGNKGYIKFSSQELEVEMEFDFKGIYSEGGKRKILSMEKRKK